MSEPATSSRGRLLAVFLLLLGLYLVARALGFDELLSPPRLRAEVERAGALGPLLFVGLFVAAMLLQIPGVVFVLAAPALFPPFSAWVLCTLAGNASVMLSFAMVRRIGGQPLGARERPWMRRVFAMLDRRPVLAVALLRAATIMFPPVTSALALTSLSHRDHALGSCLGLVVSISWLMALSLLVQ